MLNWHLLLDEHSFDFHTDVVNYHVVLHVTAIVLNS